MSKTWSDSLLKEAVMKSTTMSDVLRHIGIRFGGGSFKLVKGHVQRLGLDTSHFRKSSNGLKGKKRFTHEEVFIEHSPVSKSALRRIVIRDNVIPRVCAIPECGNIGSHLGKPLSLQLDHKNGTDDDNRLENLRWLCPNCHTQTETYSRTKYKEKVPNEPNSWCELCAKPYWRRASYIRYSEKNGRKSFCSMKCMKEHQRSNGCPLKPTAEDLAVLIVNHPATHLAQRFGVSDRAIKKWCDQYGIKTPGPGSRTKCKIPA